MIDDDVSTGLSQWVGVLDEAGPTDVIDWHHRKMREDDDG